MTIPRFLEILDLPQAEVASICGVTQSQVSRWKSGKTIPQGVALLRLVALSKGKIRIADVPVSKRGPKPKAA